MTTANGYTLQTSEQIVYEKYLIQLTAAALAGLGSRNIPEHIEGTEAIAKYLAKRAVQIAEFTLDEMATRFDMLYADR